MKRILWGLAIIIIPAFVLWGAGSWGERRRPAGVIFGKNVSLNDYMGAWEAARNEMLLTYGSAFYQIADQIDLDARAWDRLIMLTEAEKRKISVSDSEVASFISQIPFFLNQEGVFDFQRYQIILSNTFRRPPRKFEEDVRGNIVIAKLVRDKIKDVSVSEEEIEEGLRKEEEKKLEQEKKGSEEKKKTEEKPKKKGFFGAVGDLFKGMLGMGAKKNEEAPEDKAGEAREEEDTPEQRRERIKAALLMQKRSQALQDYKEGLYQKSGFINNLQKPSEESPQEDTSE